MPDVGPEVADGTPGEPSDVGPAGEPDTDGGKEVGADVEARPAAGPTQALTRNTEAATPTEAIRRAERGR